MSIEANGLPSLASNPEGVGAVYLSGNNDLLGIHLDNLKNFDAGQRQKEAMKYAQKQQALKMVADLKYNPEGILPNHTPYFRERADKLFNDFAKIQGKYGGNVSAPGYLQEISKWNVDKQKFETDLAGSKTMNTKLQTAATKYDPNKIDRSHVQNMAMQRVQTPEDLFDKGQIADLDTRMPLFTPKRVQLTEAVAQQMKQVPPSITSKAIRDEQGRVVTEEVSTYTQQQLNEMAKSAYRSGGELTEDINYEFDNLNPFAKASYIELANKMSTPDKAVAPQELYYKSLIPNTIEQKREQAMYSPRDREAAKYEYANKDMEGSVRWDADRVDNFFSESDETWGDAVEGEVVDESTPSQVLMSKRKEQFTDLGRRKIGTATIPQYKKDARGNPLKDANGELIVETYKTFPNEMLLGKKVDNKRYVQTTESMARVASGVPNATGWIEVTPTEYADMLSLGSSNPTKYKAAMLNELERRKQYENKQVRPSETGQVMEAKSKSGKPIVSNDGGKTWRYK